MNLKTHVNPHLYNYLVKFGTREHPVLAELREYTKELDNGNMQIPVDQGQFMMRLAQIMNAKRYLEIGVFTGYSALTMALAMREDSIVVALEHNSDYSTIASKFWQRANVEHRIQLLLQDALITCEELLQSNKSNYFDIAFIDADKRNLLKYYEYCLKLIRPHGIILVDNVLFHGKVLDTQKSELVESIHEFNEFIHNDCRVDISMLSIGDGLTLIFKL